MRSHFITCGAVIISWILYLAFFLISSAVKLCLNSSMHSLYMCLTTTSFYNKYNIVLQTGIHYYSLKFQLKKHWYLSVSVTYNVNTVSLLLNVYFVSDLLSVTMTTVGVSHPSDHKTGSLCFDNYIAVIINVQSLHLTLRLMDSCLYNATCYPSSTSA